jgi:hypothetical protein
MRLLRSPLTISIRVLVRNCQALSAFFAPSLQHEPSAFGAHAGPEAVLSQSLNVSRLIGSFHDSLSESTRGYYTEEENG